MSKYLKLSTTSSVKLGPFLDKTDGVTPETSVTPSIRVSKDNADFVSRTSAGSVVHDEEGWYTVPLETSDVDALGRLIISASDPNVHLPVWDEFDVVPANIYDSLASGTDYLKVDLEEISGLPVDTSGTPEVNLTKVLGTNVTETTAGRIAGNLSTFYDNSDGVTTKTVDDVGVAGASLQTSDVYNMLELYDSPTRTEATADKDAIIAQGDSAWATATGFATSELALELSVRFDDLQAEHAALNDISTSDVGTIVDERLTSTEVNANIQSLNDVPLTGDGSGSPFNV